MKNFIFCEWSFEITWGYWNLWSLKFSSTTLNFFPKTSFEFALNRRLLRLRESDNLDTVNDNKSAAWALIINWN